MIDVLTKLFDLAETGKSCKAVKSNYLVYAKTSDTFFTCYDKIGFKLVASAGFTEYCCVSSSLGCITMVYN